VIWMMVNPMAEQICKELSAVAHLQLLLHEYLQDWFRTAQPPNYSLLLELISPFHPVQSTDRKCYTQLC